MIYSNNYAKYIEKLKLEKNKKAFQRIVESTKEVKSEKIIYEDNLSEKNKSSIYLEEAPDSKERSSIFSEGDLSSKNNDKLEGELPYVNVSEYGSIQKERDIDHSEKKESKISVEDSKYSTNSKIIGDIEQNSEKAKA